MHTYYCEVEGKSVQILERRTKPKMSHVITACGSKWQVWYVEHHGDRCLARLEPYRADA